MYGVTHMLRTYQGRASSTTKANNVAALQNEQMVFVPDDNYRDPSKEAKHQQDLLKDYFNHLGAFSGPDDRI